MSSFLIFFGITRETKLNELKSDYRDGGLKMLNIIEFNKTLRADVSKYRPEVYKSEKSKILKKIHKVALGKLLT